MQAFIEQGTFCPLTALRKPNVDLDSHAARGEYMKAKLHLVQHKLGAFPPALLTEVPQCQLDMQVARDVPDDRAVPMETDKLVPGSPEAKVAMLYNMLNMSDGQIRVHAGRWTKYESMEAPIWAKEKQPSWNDALAMERRTHPSDQGGHFVEFHTYTEEEIEDHRRLGLRPLWRDLKGHFFAWEPAPASGGAGTCWVKEVQTWTLPTLLGVYGHQFSLKQLWYAWENLPIAVQRHGRGQRGGGAEGARERVLERKKIQQETNDFLEVMNIPKPTTQEEWRFHHTYPCSCDGPPHCDSCGLQRAPQISCNVMRGFLSLLRSSASSQMSTPSWSPTWLRIHLWKYRWHGDATPSSGGGQKCIHLKRVHSTRSLATLMRPSVLLAWIRRVLWAHLTCMQLPLALIRAPSLLC